MRETEVGGAARCFRQTRSNQRGSMRGVPPHMNVRVAYPRFPSTAFACPHAKAGATRKGRMAEKLYACVRGPGLGHDRAASRPAAAAHWCARRRPRVALTVLLDTSAEVTLREIVPALVVVEAGGKRARRVPARIQAAVWALRDGHRLRGADQGPHAPTMQSPPSKCALDFLHDTLRSCRRPRGAWICALALKRNLSPLGALRVTRAAVRGVAPHRLTWREGVMGLQ